MQRQSLADWIRTYGISRLALALGVHRTAVHGWLRRDQMISAPAMVRLSELSGFSCKRILQEIAPAAAKRALRGVAHNG